VFSRTAVQAVRLDIIHGMCASPRRLHSTKESLAKARCILDISSPRIERETIPASVTKTSNLIAPRRVSLCCVILPYCCQTLCVTTAPSTAFSPIHISCPVFNSCVIEATPRCSEERGNRMGRNLGTCCHATRCHFPKDHYRSVTLFWLFCSLFYFN
jgi:hypothetical protein